MDPWTNRRNLGPEGPLMPEPIYARIDTELGGIAEVYESLTPLGLGGGVMLRLSVNSLTDRRSAEVYLDPKSQRELALALLDNLQE